MLKGLSQTLKEFFNKPVTISYPEEKRPVRQRFRGRHVLTRYENGLEKCIGCALCAAACPADAIFVEAAEKRMPSDFRPASDTLACTKLTCYAVYFAGSVKIPAQRKQLFYATSTSFQSMIARMRFTPKRCCLSRCRKAAKLPRR